MRSRRRAAYLSAGAVAAAIVAALAWISVTTLGLERSEHQARARAADQEAASLALWVMDSWLAPLLAREAARPYEEYLPYYRPEQVYTRLLEEISPGEVLARSPLLEARPHTIKLYFQMDEEGNLTSPQAPRGNQRDLAEVMCLMPGEVDASQRVLDEFAKSVDAPSLTEKITKAEAQIELGESALAAPPLDAEPSQQHVQLEDNIGVAAQSRARSSLAKGAGDYQLSLAANQAAADAGRRRRPGALVPIWLLDGAGDWQLIYARKVALENGAYVQGFLIDWALLERELIAQIADIVPGCRLEPVIGDHAPSLDGRRLATVPAAIILADTAPAGGPGLTPARLALGLSWFAVIGALIAGSLSLRTMLNAAERRTRFAAAVTHELRTPLTTFRLYSEMLRDGMVTDAERRQLYLETLAKEASRLAAIVVTVLAYARLEEGRAIARTETLILVDALERVRGEVEAGARECGIALKFALPISSDSVASQLIRVDVGFLGQILTILIDNAGKYAARAGDTNVEIEAHCGARGTVEIHVTDHGPGVPGAERRRIFEPFNRGALAAGDPAPGVGLGLAIARGLAADLGGKLECRARADGQSGACFVLTLPLERASANGGLPSP